ncbi:MAG: hypothetical protein U9Q27_00100 [Patescibacteria group bacterium]|nr:hypothetical protein [Patescibacteria group bacterium]
METIILLSPDHFHSGTLDNDNEFITLDWKSGSEKIHNFLNIFILLNL